MVPYGMPQSQCKARFVKQGHGVPLPVIRGISVPLGKGDLAAEGDNAFIRSVHRARHLSSMVSLRASENLADVRLERKLRYNFAKLKA